MQRKYHVLESMVGLLWIIHLKFAISYTQYVKITTEQGLSLMLCSLHALYVCAHALYKMNSA